MLSTRSADQLYEAAVKSGMVGMFDDGLRKVAKGRTTLEEVTRVVPPPADEDELSAVGPNKVVSMPGWQS